MFSFLSDGNRPAFFAMFYRSVGVCIGSFLAFYGLRVVLEIGGEVGPVAVMILSLVAFMNLFTFGIGRPLYSAVREASANKGNTIVNLEQLFRLSLYLPVFGVIAFAFMIVSYAAAIGYSSYFFQILCFSLGVASHYVGLFQRDLLYALDCEGSFEKYEVYRKLSLLLSFFVLSLSARYDIFVVMSIVFSAVLYIMPIYLCWRGQKRDIESEAGRKIISLVSILKDARYYFLFMLVELVVYNLPLLFFMVTKNANGIILFAVWMRFFQFAVLPSRILIDSFINKIIRLYLEGDFIRSKKILFVVLLVAVILLTPLLLILYWFLPEINEWLNVEIDVDNWELFVCVALWSLANVVHHVFGSFLVSCGSGFKKAFLFSLWTSVLMVVLSVIVFFYGGVAIELIALLGVLYALRVPFASRLALGFFRSAPG